MGFRCLFLTAPHIEEMGRREIKDGCVVKRGTIRELWTWRPQGCCSLPPVIRNERAVDQHPLDASGHCNARAPVCCPPLPPVG